MAACLAAGDARATAFPRRSSAFILFTHAAFNVAGTAATYARTLTLGGSISSDLALDFSSLGLTGQLSASFDRTTGALSIVAIPEPSRALLLLVGLQGLLLRRRRRPTQA